MPVRTRRPLRVAALVALAGCLTGLAVGCQFFQTRGPTRPVPLPPGVKPNDLIDRLAGDPAFELLPALHNRWDEVLGADDPHRAVRRRFDAMVEVMGLDRQRAVRWTLGRTLQNSLWTIQDGGQALEARQVLVAESLT